MRPKGAVNSLKYELERELLSVYRSILATNENLTFSEVCQKIATHSASRFYLPYRYVREYCEKRSSGIEPHTNRSYRKCLLEAFYDKICVEMQNAKRFDNKHRVYCRVLNSTAPSFGLTPFYIQIIISRYLRSNRRRHKPQPL